MLWKGSTASAPGSMAWSAAGATWAADCTTLDTAAGLATGALGGALIVTPIRSSDRMMTFRFSSGSPWKYSMCWMPARGYLRLGGICVGSRCTGRMCPLRSLASTTSFATLCERTADSVTMSSSTFALSSAWTISSPHMVAPSMPPTSIHSGTPAWLSFVVSARTLSLSSRE
jgi:hypothetical protein